ncbi:MAG: AI-2E family transporter [Candidatus Nealsonbacteria bacterium]|nr:AI-2E family transporter [Candidatus Nealsonbacteria bacterium]
MKTNMRDEQVWLAVGSLVILASAAVAAILVYAKGVVVPFVLAIFVTVMISPILDFQVVRWKFPRAAAVATTLLLVFAILGVMGLLLYAAVPSIGTPEAADPDQQFSSGFDSMLENSLTTLRAWGIDLDQTAVEAELEGLIAEMQQKAIYIATQTAGTVKSLLSQGFLIVIFVIFLLAGRDSHVVRTGIYAEIEAKIRTYITTKFVLSGVTGILVWAVLASFGLKMAALFGMMAFLLNFIPSIGSVIATLLPLPVALGQFGNPLDVWAILGVLLIPGVIQVTVGNVIEPKIMGQGLQLHPVTILLALAVWGLLWGAIGMLLSVPITATIRIILMRFETTRPLGNLLAGELSTTGPPATAT